MSAKNPRIHTVLEPPLFEAVKRLAEEQGLTLSEEARDLIREALELREDRGLNALAEHRRKSFDPKKALSVADLRRRLRIQ